MSEAFIKHLSTELAKIREAGLFKGERVLTTPQGAHIGVPGRDDVLNMCANNYLGLADHPEIVTAAKEALDRWGYGLASVRFICGTQQLHKELESKLSAFLGTEDTILYSSCFHAAEGLFEPLLGPEDAIVSDQLNHACIIDGIRLCKASRYRYGNNDMADLESKLAEAREKGARNIIVVSDGVFSMDGYVASLPAICDLKEKYGAVLAIDDSHAVGFMGAGGRGTHEHHGVMGRVDILLGTLGKALGGAAGGYTSGKREVIEMLRQRSRTYLFSNTLPPVVVAASLKALDLVSEQGELRERLVENTAFFRGEMEKSGFDILAGEHPIVPVMLGDAALAARMAERLLGKGVYVIAFSYPVVPEGKARIRVQVSAAHSREDLEFAVRCFAEVKEELDV